MTQWSVYMISTISGKLYTGISTDIERRLKEHKKKKGARFFHFSDPSSIVYQEHYETRSEALKREHQIKKMNRQEKLKLLKEKDG